jgi:hypothetical protein
MIVRGLDPREAAAAVYVPRHQREGWETYGQIESHVRQVWNGTVGWSRPGPKSWSPPASRRTSTCSAA